MKFSFWSGGRVVMKALDDLVDRAKSDPRHIVLAEGEDPRVLEGGIRAVRDGLARITLLGRRDRIEELLRERDLDDVPFDLVDPATSPMLNRDGEAPGQ